MNEGRLDLDSLRAQGVDPNLLAKCEEQTEDILKQVSPPGELNLPPLLDARRIEHGIIDGAFAAEAAYNRVFIWQLPDKEFEGGTYGKDSMILAPQNTQSRENHEAPRGIVVSAGLVALDGLRSHGIDLGHIVTLLREVPFRLRVGYAGSKAHHLLVITTGDICGNEDLAESRRLGEVKVVLHGEQHKLETRDGQPWSPISGVNPRGTNGY